MAETNNPDLTQLSPAALDEWLGACERIVRTEFCDDGPDAKMITALVRYVRTLLPLREQVERQHVGAVCAIELTADAYRKVAAERATLAARVAELEGAVKLAIPWIGSSRTGPAWATGEAQQRNAEMCDEAFRSCTSLVSGDAALAGGKEAPRAD